MSTLWPTPLEMLRAKRAGKIITIGLPGGCDCRLSIYLHSWKRLLTLDPQTSVANWEWYPVSAGEILHKISAGVHDRINQKLSWAACLTRRRERESDIRLKLEELVRRGLLKCDCRWCGQPLSTYQPKAARFCDASCRHDYNH